MLIFIEFEGKIVFRIQNEEKVYLGIMLAL